MIKWFWAIFSLGAPKDREALNNAKLTLYDFFFLFFTVNRQKVSSHLNLAYFSILADRHGLLTPEESRSKLPNSFHVLKKIPFRHHKTQLELA